ncbi:MAG: hypothetical protein AAFU79_04905 [Myxococcota bacterium]
MSLIQSARFFVPLLGAVLLLESTPAEASAPFLRVKFEEPGWGSIQGRSGWRLSLKVTFTDRAITFAGDLPTYGSGSTAILRDVDGCLAFEDCSQNVPQCPPGDENPFCLRDVLLFVQPDVDIPGLLDPRGYGGFRNPPGPPNLIFYDNQAAFVGPAGDELAGIDYGRNEDFRGLVILSNVGAGRFLEGVVTARDAQGRPTDYALREIQPLARRNLAGLMTDVTFELRNRPIPLRPTSSVGVSMVVPPFLFARYRFVDRCVGGNGDPDTCLTSEFIDRPEPLTVDPRFARWFFPGIDINSAENAIVRLQAFVVEGQAPDALPDCDNDGDVDVEDARCAGYNVLSDVGRVSFATTENHWCFSLDGISFGIPWFLQKSEIEVDLDGNGQTRFPFSCGDPGGGGATRRKSPPM